MEKIRNIKATGFKLNDKQKIISYESMGMDVVEMCEIDTGRLIGRKQREKVLTGENKPWEWTYGMPQEDESNGNPVFLRKDSDNYFQWLVRNIPYPPETYSVIVNEENNQIIIKTSNRKFFKVIKSPMNSLKFKKSKLEWAWSRNMLVVRYPMPQEAIDEASFERKWRLSVPLVENKEDCRI